MSNTDTFFSGDWRDVNVSTFARLIKSGSFNSLNNDVGLNIDTVVTSHDSNSLGSSYHHSIVNMPTTSDSTTLSDFYFLSISQLI